MSKKLTFEEVREYIEGENGNGCTLISTEYTNNKTPLSIRCACGEVFKKRFSQFKNGQKQCRKCGYKKEINKSKIKCDYCHTIIERYPSLIFKHNFCCNECRNKWQSENIRGENHPCYGREGLKGENNPNWQGGGIMVNCDYCHKEIEISKYKYKKDNYHFCNNECKAKWQEENMRGENHPSYGKKIEKEKTSYVWKTS